jgi:type VI secretion system secreted protein Hcp
MAVDMFLVFEHADLKGETQDTTYKDKGGIDVLAWSWGMSQSGTFHVGGGSGAGKVNVQDISITKYVDKASPILMLFCCNGGHIPKATLVVRKAGTTPLEYITIVMEPVMVTSVSTGGSGGEDRLTENIVLNAKKVTVKYIEQLPDGKEGGKPEFGWDIAANVKV